MRKFLRATVKALTLTRDQPEAAARVAEQALGMEGKAALSAVQAIVGAISAKDPGGFSEFGMHAWIADNATGAGTKNR